MCTVLLQNEELSIATRGIFTDRCREPSPRSATPPASDGRKVCRASTQCSRCPIRPASAKRRGSGRSAARTARASPGARDSMNAATFKEAYESATEYPRKLLDGSMRMFRAGRTLGANSTGGTIERDPVGGHARHQRSWQGRMRLPQCRAKQFGYGSGR